MPKIRAGMPKPPPGFDAVAPVLDEYEARMRAAIAEPHAGKRKAETTWGVAEVNRERTRAVFNLVRAGTVSKEVLEYCVKVKFVDGSLVKLWSIKGYESACCAECVQPRNHTFGGACICRVPARDRAEDAIQCSHCGCTGCASGSGDAKRGSGDKPAAAAAVAEEEKDTDADHL
jgi:bud site selection protein 31